MEIKPIAKIKTDFQSKFGIPRQSGRVEGLEGEIIFEKEFRNEAFIKGIEQYSHLWIIWEFSENEAHSLTSTVRPPRLGGNKKIGVFASRSPFRPNNLGLSCVKLIEVRKNNGAASLIVSGADLMNGTPIYDIKPYIAYTDCIENAESGFSEEFKGYSLKLECEEKLLSMLEPGKREALLGILAEDPRPAYHKDETRIYGFPFAGFEIRFRVKGDTLKVLSIEKNEK